MKEHVEQKLNNGIKIIFDPSTVEQQIEKLNVRVQYMNDLLSPNAVKKKKSWMMNEILELMEKRRLYKNVPSKSKVIDKGIQRKISEVKENELKDQCKETETL